MQILRSHRVRTLMAALAAGLVSILMLSGPSVTANASLTAQDQTGSHRVIHKPTTSAGKPTVVLVHGAFADSGERAGARGR